MLLFYFSVHRRPGGNEHIRFDAQAGAAVFLGFYKKKPRRGVRLILHKGQTLRLEAVRPQHSQHLGQTLGPMAEGKLSAVLQQAEPQAQTSSRVQSASWRAGGTAASVLCGPAVK